MFKWYNYYNKRYFYLTIWENLRAWYYELIDYFKQGFPDSEIWELAQSNAQWILPRLKRFKEIKTGFPVSIAYELFENFDPATATNEQWEATHKKFDEYLDKMIFSFEHLVSDDWEMENYYKHGLDKDHTDSIPFELIVDEEDHRKRFEAHRQDVDAINIKIQEGLDLYAKYYRALWD